MKIDPNESLITTGIAAKKLGISPRLLIKYEQSSLIIVYKTKMGHRLYSERDLAWLDFIHDQITNNKLKIASLHLLLALTPCWKIKSECSESDCKGCQAYKNYNIICWALDDQGSRLCREENCRDCEVYQYATLPKNIVKMSANILSDKK